MKELVIHKTLDASVELINEFDWAGACFATSAINYILLKEQGVVSTPRLGVVGIDGSIFDHAWIEIDDLIYDVAIIKPIENNFSHIIGDAGLRGEIESGEIYGSEDSFVIYGFEREIDQEILTALDTIGYFMTSNSPFFDLSIDYWQLTVELGKKLNLSLCRDDLIKKYSTDKWKVSK